mmetsp:Transcript_21207/g.63526  ORF Transcript_21207/g.63526 Transcript_21207/m.63526 type:complete len:522 (-) Transcript_21207:302-1867(-)
MEHLVHNGLVRSIGASNLSVVKLDALLKGCTIRPAVNQVEMHPFFRNDELLAYCKEQGVHVTAYSPLGSPDSADVMKRRYTPSLLSHPVVTRLADKHGRNPGQILVQWAVQRGTSVLPKSVTPKRIAGNIDVIGWRLEQDEMEELSSFELQVRLVDGSFWIDPRGPYKTLNELWDRPDEDERQQHIVAAAYTNLGGVINGVPMPVAKLNSGYSMPLVGLGTWKSERGEVKSAVEAAIRMGYRHIDCASVYQNEGEVGEALDVIQKEGIVPRDDLFITSKLWNTEHLPSRVIEACRRSLKALQLDYLDLYLVHWPASGPPEPGLVHKYTATWSAMEELVSSGLVRSIGVSNLSVVKLDALFQECAIRPAVNQVEAHPYWRNDHLRAFCAARDVHMTAYSPLGSPDSAAMLGRSADLKGPMHDPVVTAVAERVGRSPAQVLLRWGVQRGTSVLPKSVHEERLASNLDIVGWELPEDCFHELSCLPTQMRMVPGTFLLQPNGPYRTLGELWDEEDPLGEAPNKM